MTLLKALAPSLPSFLFRRLFNSPFSLRSFLFSHSSFLPFFNRLFLESRLSGILSLSSKDFFPLSSFKKDKVNGKGAYAGINERLFLKGRKKVGAYFKTILSPFFLIIPFPPPDFAFLFLFKAKKRQMAEKWGKLRRGRL